MLTVGQKQHKIPSGGTIGECGVDGHPSVLLCAHHCVLAKVDGEGLTCGLVCGSDSLLFEVGGNIAHNAHGSVDGERLDDAIRPNAGAAINHDVYECQGVSEGCLVLLAFGEGFGGKHKVALANKVVDTLGLLHGRGNGQSHALHVVAIALGIGIYGIETETLSLGLGSIATEGCNGCALGRLAPSKGCVAATTLKPSTNLVGGAPSNLAILVYTGTANLVNGCADAEVALCRLLTFGLHAVQIIVCARHCKTSGQQCHHIDRNLFHCLFPPFVC